NQEPEMMIMTPVRMMMTMMAHLMILMVMFQREMMMKAMMADRMMGMTGVVHRMKNQEPEMMIMIPGRMVMTMMAHLMILMMMFQREMMMKVMMADRIMGMTTLLPSKKNQEPEMMIMIPVRMVITMMAHLMIQMMMFLREMRMTPMTEMT